MKNRSDHLKAACKKNKMAASSVNAYYLYVLKVGIDIRDRSKIRDITPTCSPVSTSGLVPGVQGGLHQLVPQPPEAGRQDGGPGAAAHGDIPQVRSG